LVGTSGLILTIIIHPPFDRKCDILHLNTHKWNKTRIPC
jgi:hypothetical protein